MADEPETLPEADEARFGGQPQGDEPAGYTANFDGDEIDGKRYQMGDTIDASVDPGTIAFLVQNGRITPFSAGSGESPSGSKGGTGIPPPAGEENATPTLTSEQQTEADALVNDKSKDELLALAKSEGVEGVTGDNNKAEIAAKIVAARAE